MTDNIEVQEESQLEAIEALDIATLRRFAKLSQIQAKKDWTKEDYVNAIKNKQANAGAALVFDNKLGPKAGYSRIILQRDPMPGSKNTSVHVSMNGHIFAIPRGVPVDIPEPLVEVLVNARTIDTTEQSTAAQNNPGGHYVDIDRPSYPFQVVATNPGEYKSKVDTRASTYAQRKEFHTKYGTWPTSAELAEYRKAKLNNSTF